MNRRHLAAAAAGGLLVAGLVFAIPEALAWADVRALLLAAKDRLAAQEYPRARADLERLLREHPDAGAADEARLLVARSHLLEGDARAAERAAAAFLETRPESPLAPQAIYVRAQALFQLRRAAEAAEALEGRLLELSSPARRGELAQLYVSLADEFYEPPAPPRGEAPRPDWARALDLYGRALAVGVADGREGELLFRIATCRFQLGRVDEAARTLERLRSRADDPALLARALLLEGQLRVRLGAADAGRALLRELEARFPASDEAARAVVALGDSYQPEQTASDEARRLAIEHYQRFLARHGEHPLAPEVLLLLARSEAAGRRFEPAIEALRAFVQRFPEHAMTGEARFLVGDFLLRMGRYPAGREALGAFLGAHPSHARFVVAQNSIATSWIDQGEAAAAVDDPRAAARAWRAFLEAYPVHERAAGVQTRLGELLFAHDEREAGLAAWQAVSERYPGTPQGARAHMLIAQACEGPLADLGRATREYEALIARFPHTGEAHTARQALSVLREKHLRLLTPGSRPVARGPVVSLALRNVPRLQLKAYRVDLVQYFERKHHVGSVEELAVDIVKPDATWSYEVPGYEPFRLFEQEVALEPLDGPGAWVLVAEEDEFKATTLVIASDVTTIVKRSPGQLLVFAQDEATGAPAPGVDVLVSDGREVFLRGRTGDDGVLLTSDARLHGEARVLAHRAGSVAFDGGRPGSRGAFGYSPKCFVFTDRPVYRPGQPVRWKLFARRVEAGGYTARAGEECRVAVIDPRGVRLQDALLRTGPGGALDGEVTLGTEPPMGVYTVQVQYAGAVGSAQFHVEAYRKPEVVVSCEPARGDYLTGDEVEVQVGVATYYGGLVPGAPVSWQVYRQPAEFDRSLHRGFAWFFERREDAHERQPALEPVASGAGATDERGQLKLSFPTAVVDQDMLYTVVVSTRGLDQRPVAGAANVHVTTRGYYALVECESQVVRPRQRFRVMVETVDARHQGRPARGELQVLRLAGGGEEVTGRHPVETGADGKAEVTLTLERAGDYALRFVGRDRREGAVEGEARVVVEGVAEDLARQARIRADREVYRRGDEARVLINTPAEGVQALLTFEGEQVLGYQVVPLKARSETVTLRLDDRFAPNAYLKVAVAHRGELYEDEDQVLVFKYLDVEVRAAKAEYGPGEEVALEVVTRDQTGNPVEAEVALVVVDEAIYAIRPDRTPGLKPFFYDQRRQNAVTTGSSARWRYQGTTVRQLQELLAEREQRDMEQRLRQELADRQAQLRGLREEAMELDQALEGAPRPMAPPAPAAEAPPGASFGAGGGARGRRQGAAGPMADAEKAMTGGEANGETAVEARRLFADTALWAPRVRTGRDGRARLTFRVPEDLTTWRITARGASDETLVGDARGAFRTAKELVTTLALPRAVTQADSYRVGLIVDNRGAAPVEARAGISWRLLPAPGPGGPESILEEARATQVALGPQQARRVDFQGPLPATPGALEVTGQARVQGGAADALRRTVTVLPVGVPERQAASGLLEGLSVHRFEVSPQRVPGTAELVITLSPSGTTAVLNGLEYLDAFPYGCIEQTVSRFLPLVAARELLLRSGLPHEALRRRIEDGVERGVRRLVDLQRPDGGWGWWHGDPSQPWLTAYALVGLTEAARHGTYVDPNVLARAHQAALQQLRRVGEDMEGRAALCYALALRDERRGLTDDLNRLTRSRDLLSTRALAQLILCRLRTGEGSLAELIAALTARARRGADGVSFPGPEVAAGRAEGGIFEHTAWAGLALRAGPAADEALIGDIVRWLRATQSAEGGWRSTRETAPVLAFLAAVEQERRGRAADLRVDVALNGQRVAGVRLQGEPGGERVVRLGDDRLRAGLNELQLTKDGAGSARFTARLRYVRAGDLQLPTGKLLTVARDLLPWNDPRARRAFPQHATILRPRPGQESEALAVTEAAVGERLWLRVRVSAEEPLSYALAEVPLPGGVEVVRDQTQGRFDRLEVLDDRIALFWTALPRGTTEARVLVQAVTPGRFLALPAAAELMYSPELQGRSAALTLEIGDEPVERAPTADALLLQVRELLAAGEDGQARLLLHRLRAMDLVVEARAEVLLALLRIGLRAGDARLAIESYEALRDDAPRALGELTLLERRDLALAYRRAGEHEQAYARAQEVLLLLFQEDAALAEVYRALRRPLAAQDHLGQVLLRYPELGPIVDGWFALAAAYVEIPRQGGGPRPRHWRPDGSADTMLEEAYRGYKDFCAYFPRSPRAPQAQAGAVAALARLGEDEGVAAEAQAFAGRYPAHELLDDVLVQRLRALHRLGRWEEAFACGGQLLEYTEVRDRRQVPSPFRDEVLHTFARIHHQRGEIARAVGFYAQVKDRIPDARDAHAYFTAVDITIPDVVRFAPGEPASLPVRSKNAATLQLQVYPVDFMILFLTRKNLAGIHDIDLTGIAPVIEREDALGASDDYAWKERALPLPSLEPGVYLVVGKAGGLHRSAIVAISELQLEVQRTPQRVRVYASTRDGRPAPGARVRVTDGQRLVAQGDTDARGVFEGEVHTRTPLSVVVERAGHYGLFRE